MPPLSTPQAVDSSSFPALFASRAPDSHKGSFGTVGIVGGGPGMTGAALLAARAALMCGAGKVLVGFTDTPAPIAYDPLQPELMCHDALSIIQGDFGVTVWVAGSGAGHAAYSKDALQTLFASRGRTPLVIDADALNLLAKGELTPNWGEDGPVVLTPHPAEAARLLSNKTSDVQSNRLESARTLAYRFRAWVVLKGAGTIVCDPEGNATTNTSGNPGLATAGTGDVLAGLLGSLIGQGVSLDQATRGGVWLHGAAADACVEAGIGPIGLTAGELVPFVRLIRNKMIEPKISTAINTRRFGIKATT